jgi:hypothetical protein
MLSSSRTKQRDVVYKLHGAEQTCIRGAQPEANMQQEPRAALAAIAGSHAATGPAAAKSAALGMSCCMGNHDSSERRHQLTHQFSQRKDVHKPTCNSRLNNLQTSGLPDW